jgi:signal transduction histidine kinase
VADEGIGIPKDELPGILQPSVRGSNARGASGSGMGLSLVSRIVSAHRGSLKIESEVGEGTTVQIIIPTIP